MNVTIVIVVVTFISALIEKFSKNLKLRKKWLFKKINFEFVTMGLLLLLLIFQIWESINSSEKEAKNENQSAETYKNVVSSHEKINVANQYLDSIAKSLNIEIETINKEFAFFERLNDDIKVVRNNLEKNLTEFNKLNDQYTKQLELEREKISSAEPDLRITIVHSVFDSVSFSYQFSFSNTGKRVADSVKYYSAMIFVDSSAKVFQPNLIKSNYNEYNVLSVPGEVMNAYFINSPSIPKGEIRSYFIGFLFIRFSFNDNMIASSKKTELRIFKTSSLNKGGEQYGENIDNDLVIGIKKYLYLNDAMSYKILFEE